MKLHNDFVPYHNLTDESKALLTRADVIFWAETPYVPMETVVNLKLQTLPDKGEQVDELSS